ncbi:MAG TPA: MotA/TolQ/ExbB proton channel family protein [Gammaproteobacteria bacterium]
MRNLFCILAGVLLLASAPTMAQEENAATSPRELLELIEQGRARDAVEQRQRLEEFLGEEARQEQILRERQAELARLEALSSELESRFQSREQDVAQLETQLDTRLGSLKEMFGVLQQVAGDLRGTVNASVISSQYPEREAFLDQLIEKAGSSSTLPSIAEIERLWFEMQRETVASGEIVRYDAPVTTVDGEVREQSVVRIGAFNVISSGEYLHFVPETNRLGELARQPGARYLSTAEDFAAAKEGLNAFWVDPSRGALLSLLIQAPGFSERVEQGGTVGYIIIALGLLALALAAERFIVLWRIDRKVTRQIMAKEPRDDNPLGRIMLTYEKYRRTDKETLELRLGEAIVQETPKLSRFLPFLKITAVVAPLLGLLGTVTGMINTFQAITLFGTGDPQIMAGGISQALVTTVQGLCVAIPAVLLHTLVNSRSRRIVQTLEERAVGIVAEHAEQDAGHVAAA